MHYYRRYCKRKKSKLLPPYVHFCAQTDFIAMQTKPASTDANTSTSESNQKLSSSSSAFKSYSRLYARFQGTRTYRAYSFVSKRRRPLLFGAALLYFGTVYTKATINARKRDKIADSTFLYWKIYDGSIVEAKTAATAISLLFSGSGGGSDEPARVMTLFEVVKALSWAQRDDRIVSSKSLPFI